MIGTRGIKAKFVQGFVEGFDAVPSGPAVPVRDDQNSPGIPGGGDFAVSSDQDKETRKMLKKLSTVFAVAALLFSLSAMPTLAQDKMTGQEKGKMDAAKDKKGAAAARGHAATDAAAATAAPKKARRHARKARGAAADAAGTGAAMEKRKP